LSPSLLTRPGNSVAQQKYTACTGTPKLAGFPGLRALSFATIAQQQTFGNVAIIIFQSSLPHFVLESARTNMCGMQLNNRSDWCSRCMSYFSMIVMLDLQHTLFARPVVLCSVRRFPQADKLTVTLSGSSKSNL